MKYPDISSVAFYALLLLVGGLSVFMLFLPRIISGRKEEKARRSQEELITESFSMIGVELKALKEQLLMKERLATLGEVSAGIAHELRNPLSVILGYAKLLLRDIDPDDPRHKTVNSIIREIEAMNRVMDELMRFSKAEPLNRVEIDLGQVIYEAVQDSLRPASVKVEGFDSVCVKGDPLLLKQAFRNLVNNGLEESEYVHIAFRNGIWSGKKGGFVDVRDSGRGLSEHDLKKIFSPFYSTKQNGLGIGLCLVQKIAMAHGGTVEVSSEEGRGSCFSLFIPE